jgi:hypothetical protein
MSRHGDHLRRSSLFKPGDTIGNDRSEAMNRVERAIVRGIRDEFGPGMQHQHGDSSGFVIAVAGTDVLITVARDKHEPHPYVFDEDWDGLCKVCGGEQDDPLHVGLVTGWVARIPTGDYDDVREEA